MERQSSSMTSRAYEYPHPAQVSRNHEGLCGQHRVPRWLRGRKLHNDLPERDEAAGGIRNVSVRQKMARDWSMGANYIRNADTNCYGTLIADLSNQFARGKDEYPKDITSACGMLVKQLHGADQHEATAHQRELNNAECSINPSGRSHHQCRAGDQRHDVRPSAERSDGRCERRHSRRSHLLQL